MAEAVISVSRVISPVDLVWNQGDWAAAQQVLMRVESGPPLEITGAVSNLPQFEIRTETVAPGLHYILHVRPQPADKDFSAVIQVKESSL